MRSPCHTPNLIYFVDRWASCLTKNFLPVAGSCWLIKDRRQHIVDISINLINPPSLINLLWSMQKQLFLLWNFWDYAIFFVLLKSNFSTMMLQSDVSSWPIQVFVSIFLDAVTAFSNFGNWGAYNLHLRLFQCFHGACFPSTLPLSKGLPCRPYDLHSLPSGAFES